MIYIVHTELKQSSFSTCPQLLDLFWVNLALVGVCITVWIESEVRAPQVLLIDTSTPPLLGPGGKEPSRVAHPVSADTTTEYIYIHAACYFML